MGDMDVTLAELVRKEVRLGVVSVGYQREPAPGHLPAEKNETCAGLCSSYLQE